MNVFLIEMEGSYSIRYRILSQLLGFVFGHVDHLLRVHLNWLIVQLCLSYSFETTRALRQIRISVNPGITIQMRNKAPIILIPLVAHSQLGSKIDIIRSTSGFDKRIIEPVTIKSSYD